MVVDFKIESITPDSLTFAFKQPDPTNGNIVRYDLEYQFQNRSLCQDSTAMDTITKVDSCVIGNSFVCNATLDRNIRLEIDKLYPYWDYTVRVRAFTNAGPGNWTAPVTTKTNQTGKICITTLSFAIYAFY